ncbi:peptidylprolyl isomerase [Gilvimarinus agarilyticus]|uniref:peptidylprolyl isomerase n=1 Tax=Gilvimarinus sp. 2_MG-2023 TaxID=3062666 RepID=UPI001C08D16A|nr:peptidylprolyl isomerase [Gilvimarinus sp. 2_MG-2023]MBU2885926.1 peptidylprolyl isomerase [Gilvimarinus agarilyticus]MDO6570672.1 peptidylprolyl isomerase [Gilvimarinus sp. 2_MG-2023]
MSFTVKTLCSATLYLCASAALATTVQFQTVMGDFEVNLYDQDTPETVANFLEYVDSGAYENTFIHRSVPSFVVQGGGFSFDLDNDSVSAIATNEPVVNEPVFANLRGTIAMAKIGSSPNSATSQWFFNLGNNSANLDNQNEGFTVFGEVTGNGMAIVDAIADLARANFTPELFWDSGVFDVVPVRDYSQEDIDAETLPTEENIVLIQNIMVLDAAPDTAAGLNPTPTTATADSGSGGDGSGGGGSFGLRLLALLALGSLGRKLIRRG